MQAFPPRCLTSFFYASGENFPLTPLASFSSLILITFPMSSVFLGEVVYTSYVSLIVFLWSSTLQFMYEESPSKSDLEMHFLQDYETFIKSLYQLG